MQWPDTNFLRSVYHWVVWERWENKHKIGLQDNAVVQERCILLRNGFL